MRYMSRTSGWGRMRKVSASMAAITVVATSAGSRTSARLCDCSLPGERRAGDGVRMIAPQDLRVHPHGCEHGHPQPRVPVQVTDSHSAKARAACLVTEYPAGPI